MESIDNDFDGIDGGHVKFSKNTSGVIFLRLPSTDPRETVFQLRDFPLFFLPFNIKLCLEIFGKKIKRSA